MTKLIGRALLGLCLILLAAPAAAQNPLRNANGVPYSALLGCDGLTPVSASNPVCTDGASGDAATETTQQALLSAINTPATGLPPMTPVASSDTTLTQFYQSIAASGDTTLVSATAAQSTRLHSLHCSILPTSGTVTVTLKSASTTLRAVDYPAGGGILQWDYRPYWWAKTANNEALIINFSTAGAYKCAGLFVKGA